MKRLNKTQIDHAKSRISVKARNKKEVLRKELTKGKILTDEKRCSLLRSGKVKVKKGVTSVSKYTDVKDAFDFSPFDQTFDKKEYDKRAKKIDVDVNKLIDELILGDTEQALALIEKF